jgi:tRNA pseudouridine55 synthase
MIDGLVVVDKPAGMTSHDVVGRCRRIFGQRRVGHAGTLDPDATGVLLVGLGRATRLLQWVSGLEKRYEGEVVCGVATSTLDESGDVTGRWDMAAVGIEEARRVATTLTGEIDQVPPMVSAVKIGGRRLHQLAREGIEVDRPARQVRVMRFDLEEVAAATPGPHGGAPVWAVTVECSSGTYIRVLAADLGRGLGGGAYLRALRRTAVGPWSVSDAVALDDLGPTDVLPPARAVTRLDVITVDGLVAADVSHGRVLDRSGMAVEGDGPWAVLGDAGELLAVYEVHGPTRIKPAVVLVEASGPSPAG